MVLVVPEQSQRPYRFGMTLLCVGALFNWLGLADTYSDPVPAIRYIGVGLIAAGASLICMAMCFWMRNIHDPNSNSDYDISSAPIHVISSDQSLEKPPEYSTVVDVPPCYEDAIKLDATVSTPIAFRLKQALTSPSSCFASQNAEATSAEPKNRPKLDQSSPPSPDQAPDADNPDFCSLPTDIRQTGKSTSEIVPSQNSSQNENTLAKVIRKSMRGIRRFRSGSEESNNSLEQPSNSECGLVQGNSCVESAKIDR